MTDPAAYSRPNADSVIWRASPIAIGQRQVTVTECNEQTVTDWLQYAHTEYSRLAGRACGISHGTQIVWFLMPRSGRCVLGGRAVISLRAVPVGHDGRR